jgi:membrane fusion protein (multidrug efflux system)
MKDKSYLPLKLLATVFCGLLVIVACDDQATAVKAPPKVKVLKVQPTDTPVTYEFVGRTTSSQQVQVRARVEGFLDDRLYNEGSIVKKGDIMFKMDAKPFKTQLAAARAALAKQQANLETVSANLKRVKPLAEANAVSKKELDNAQGLVNSADAAVSLAQANVESAKLSLGYTTIYSPVTGASSYARIQTGAFVNSTNSLLTYVAQLDPMWVDFSVSENDMLKIRQMKDDGIVKLPENGKFEIELKLADNSSYPYTGEIFFSDASYSTDTGTFLLRASFNNSERHLRPGQFVRVFLKGAIQPDAILLPQKAVSQGAKGFFVWIIDGQEKAQVRNIQVGDWQQDNWFIQDGLSAGDRVVTDGFIHLSADSAVTIITDDSKTASAKNAEK